MELQWHIIKDLIADTAGLSRPVLHVLFGAIAFTVFGWLLRHKHRGLLHAWLIVFGLEIINEAADAYDWIRWTGGINTADTIEDIFLTMMAPTLMIAVLTGWRLIRPSRE